MTAPKQDVVMYSFDSLTGVELILSHLSDRLMFLAEAVQRIDDDGVDIGGTETRCRRLHRRLRSSGAASLGRATGERAGSGT